ncbi:MAG: sulfonate transporter ATP-binding protein [Rubritepida sp.]|nr:sulfonate transporter ATP-binding protein [Rubritepida sp.]
MLSPLLALKEVSVHFGTANRPVTAVENVSFSLSEGERLVLVGPSGCGKSTLLATVGGFLRPSAGHVLLDGVPVRRPGPDRMMVFQEFDQLLPWKSVAANIAYPLRLAGVTREVASARAEALIHQVGLTGFGDAFPHMLSGGMKMRVAIARALAAPPRLLLMDEPFAALDALTRRRMQEELLRLWHEHVFTLLFVTHSIEEAVLLGSRILVLSPHPGRVQAVLEVPEDRAARAALQADLHRLLLPEPADV